MRIITRCPMETGCVPRAKFSIAHVFSSRRSLFTCCAIRVIAFCLCSSETADTASQSKKHPPAAMDPCPELVRASRYNGWYVQGWPEVSIFSFYIQKETRPGLWAIPSSCWELLSLIPRLKRLAAVVSDAHIPSRLPSSNSAQSWSLSLFPHHPFALT